MDRLWFYHHDAAVAALPELVLQDLVAPRHQRRVGGDAGAQHDVVPARLPGELVCGVVLLLFGTLYGGWHWWQSLSSGQPAATGVIMLAAMPVLIGLQLLLAFLAYDIASVPRHALGRVRTAP